MAEPKRVVIVDDSPGFCSMWRRFFEERYDGKVAVESYLDPLKALAEIRPDIGLLVLDLEMPGLDGIKFLEYAAAKGVDRRRVVISSGRDADELHRLFPAGRCLAVINKDDPAQQAAFLMILESVMRKP
ncbi:MAG: response regulator transcription factor [Acidobacteria bacterium]|jgi:DNA-binding NarL/FixJ family response regulator|nr:response regulator transcription factor [Acidobacteriota bacterium]